MTDHSLKINAVYPKIKPTFDSLMKVIGEYELRTGDLPGIVFYSDKSGHFEDESITFDSIEDLISQLNTFNVEIYDFHKFNVNIDVLDFRGFTVCAIEERWNNKKDDFENWLKTDRIMKDKNDINGLCRFLIRSKIIPTGSKLVLKNA
jgi:hypothetical protein